MTQQIVIRDLIPSDEARWRTLWDGYVEFYGAAVPDKITDTTWAKLMGENSRVFGLVAEVDGPKDREVIGIVNCVLHDNTWSDQLICYLEDLFVDPQHRGNGAATALIEAVVDRAKARDWLRVYWMTKADNTVARTLYDKIAPVTDWVRYDVNF